MLVRELFLCIKVTLGECFLHSAVPLVSLFFFLKFNEGRGQGSQKGEISI